MGSVMGFLEFGAGDDFWSVGFDMGPPVGHGTPENGKRDPYYGTHIFRDSKMGMVWE